MSGSNARRIRTWAAALVAVTGAAAMQAHADTFYVNGSCGNDDWTGTSSVCSAPDGPKLTIQAGIDASVNGDTVIVADGTYTGAGNRDLDFAGRLIVLRSENGPQGCIIDCQANDADRHRAFNFHTNETLLAVVDGFTIRNGYQPNGGGIRCANGSSPKIRNCTLLDNTAIEWGGGMYNIGSSPTVSNCMFSGNSTGARQGDGGGGMYNLSSSPTVTDCTFSGNWLFGTALGGGMYINGGSPTVTNCTFSENSASAGGGVFNAGISPMVTNCMFNGNTAFQGGGMYNANSSATVTNCMFSGNTALPSGQGGGMFNGFGNAPTVTNCTFSENLGGSGGGGMFNSVASPTVTNCTFSENSAGSAGGGMYNQFRSSPTVTDCTFTGNTTPSGGGMYSRRSDSRPVLTNCILWNNGPDEIVEDDGAVTTVSFSDVQGGWPGTGNINADPLFVDAANGNYRLAPGSPCIDAADNTAVPKGIETDLDGSPRFVDDPDTPDCQQLPGECGDPPVVDMGAYEFQGDCDPCDMNCDGDINAFDIEPFLELLFDPNAQPCAACTGDVDGNGNINAFDIEPFLECLFP